MAALRPKATATLAVAVGQATLTSLYIAVLSVVGERLCERARNRLFRARAVFLFFSRSTVCGANPTPGWMMMCCSAGAGHGVL